MIGGLQLSLNFVGGGLSRTPCTVVLFRRGKTTVWHHYFERLGGDARIDEALSTAWPEIMGAGVLDPRRGFVVRFAHDHTGRLADEVDHAAHSLLREPPRLSDVADRKD